jgi:lipopolysaccharide transport system ATP-binding protein
MSNTAIQVKDVWKRFHRGERQDSLRDLIPALVRRIRTPARDDAALGAGDFWAVRDVNFAVDYGEALGIIGPNGAGKSTMLKLLTGILRPSEGEIRLRGRMASLIEVSAGFHQDLTGRENVFLQGAIMGMTQREIQRRLESIVDFSGIEDFIDTPVKRYSSGMNARLGFSVAVHLDPDVLIIDEVLSVGDMAFQEKCVQRMKAFKRDGVAIVFVSHNMQAIGDLCERALVIKSTPRFLGPVGDAVSRYLGLAGGGEQTTGDGATIVDVRLTDLAGNPVEAVAPHTPLRLEVEVRADVDIAEPIFSFILHRATDSLCVYDGNYTAEELRVGPMSAGQSVRLRFDHVAHLTRGQYAYKFVLHDPREAKHRLAVMPVAGIRVDEYRTWTGVADLSVEASVAA